MRRVRPEHLNGEPAFELRPKAVWRLLSPAPAVGVLALFWGDWTVWQMWLTMAWLTALAIGAQRGCIRVEQGRIFQRLVFRWGKPFLLDHLSEVSLRRKWDRGDNPHIELSMKSSDGTSFSFQPRWWTNADRLIHLVAVAASADVPDPPPRGLWRLDLDQRTRERLAGHL